MSVDVQPVKDQQLISPDGTLLAPLIDGIVLRRLPPIEDKRGDVVEIYNPAWNIHPAAMVYAYQSSLRPGAIKGWIKHALQDDRLFISHGVMRWALYDDRPDSPTYQLVNDLTLSERNRALLIIPQGVYHAVQNIGQTDAFFVNLPTRPYNHHDPDKYRLPIRNDLIPFDFDDGPGW
jgi:dTDP-4-dehydrorhamnose 3,5-epimerase